MPEYWPPTAPREKKHHDSEILNGVFYKKKKTY